MVQKCDYFRFYFRFLTQSGSEGRSAAAEVTQQDGLNTEASRGRAAQIVQRPEPPLHRADLTEPVLYMEAAGGSDAVLLLETVNFAAEKHRNQRRKDPEATPYVNHPIGVAHILSHEAGVTDICVLQAALLHDTVEDTDTSLAELESRFGAVVSGIVAEVTDDKTLSKAERKRLQVEHARHCSPRAKLVKLADKLYNLRDLQRTAPVGWSEQRVQEYFVWARDVVKGLRGTSPILEEKLDQMFTQRGVHESD
ncbi:hypothetical protein NL108_009677 [Boleophthalmus pectinirostris]|uniref:guanosine-3',5'-bis(diphosphate) 3'-pyrophosphohydrolase MESH1 n=1 Tax=Boleophthalmus pectinirostris TaxID=150288 RepID=UPI000A1C26E2|nr:guanosine-3',5'-bis(diphosphate) 3'-pyrophosphohydrolase MESH1 [Boleophthalmus pectinirostris]KAJ0056515.1 hypothetical protein NL108_009677 [Boleophthalmus pectinirostris]